MALGAEGSFCLAATLAAALLDSPRTVACREGDSDFLMISRNSRPPAVTV
jgi:hypothetical protein